jgi:broad-specificity NMP kinase
MRTVPFHSPDQTRNTNPVTIITGPPASGKTSKAIQMTEGKNAYCLQGHDILSDFWTSRLTEETEIILLDDVSRKDCLKLLITAENLIVNRKGTDSFEIKRPELVITTNCFTDADFTPRPYLKFINL